VMLKLSLMVEATVPTFGLSLWNVQLDQRPTLKWSEGLEEQELESAERFVAEAVLGKGIQPEFKTGDKSNCFLLLGPPASRPGAALYGLCSKPLSERQAKDLSAIVDVAQLAHSHVATVKPAPLTAVAQESANTSLPGMVFRSPVMADVARAVQRIKDSES